MSRILIHMNVVQHGEYDIFQPTNDQLFEKIYASSGNFPNTGNRLWLQGLISEISTPDNIITYYNYQFSCEEINEQFDMVIAPMANVFAIENESLLNHLAEHFEQVRIPVFVIACGVQAKSYDELDDLCAAIGTVSKRFMRSVYESGGEFALRGYFSKDFFDRLGFPSAVVTGCPSLFQFGNHDFSNLLANMPAAGDRDTKFIVNGNLSDFAGILRKYPNAEFFDQDQYFVYLRGIRYVSETVNSADIRELIRLIGYDSVQLLADERVKLFVNMNEWHSYLVQNAFAFSYGSRIHGSIMPILSGVPAFLWARDARTKEIAQYFEIPYTDAFLPVDEAVERIDYTGFVKGFAAKYEVYEQFLQRCGIVKHINTRNDFLNLLDHEVKMPYNHAMEQIRTEMSRKKAGYKLYSDAIGLYRLLRK